MEFTLDLYLRYRIILEVLFVESQGDARECIVMGIIFSPNDTIEQALNNGIFSLWMSQKYCSIDLLGRVDGD